MARRNNRKSGLNQVLNSVNKILTPVTTRAKRRRRTKKRQLLVNPLQRSQKTLAPVSLGVSNRNFARDITNTYSSTGYVANYQFEKLEDGQTLFSLRVDPNLLNSLATFAASYQRIRYHRLCFQLAAHLPTNTSGGYIMGFRPDASDTLPFDPLIKKQFVVATPGSVKNSIWQSYDLTVNQRELTNRLLYTSPGSDVREYSPGTFFVVTDGAVNQAGSLSLSVEFTVSCSIPSFEPNVEADIEDVATSSIKLYAYDGTAGLRIGDTSASAYATWNDVFPNFEEPKETTFYQIDIQYGVKTTDEATQDIEYSYYMAYVLNGEPGTDPRFQPRVRTADGLGSATFKSPTGNTQILPIGTKFSLYQVGETNPTPLNSQKPRSSELKRGLTHFSAIGGMTNLNSFAGYFRRLRV